MWVSEQVYLISIKSRTFQPLYSTTNVYLIGRERRLMIDAGYAHQGSLQTILSALRSLGDPPISHLIITHAHRDHFEGAEKIKELTGAKILTHPQEAQRINDHFSQTLVDDYLEEGDSIELSNGTRLLILHTPGHSPGHICLYLEAEGLLFSGDHIVGISTVVVEDMVAYLSSLKKLLNYRVEGICPAHGPFMTEGQDKIKEYYEHRLERERQIIESLRRFGPLTPYQLMLKVYAAEVDQRFYQVAEMQIKAHLAKLEQEGRLASLKTEAGRAYYLP